MDDPTTPRYAMSGFYIEMGGFLYAATIDARHRTSHAGMTRLLRSERIEMPKTDWVGRVGLADMAGKCRLCALGPMMSALILRLLLIKEKEQENRSHRCPPSRRPASA